MNSADGYDTEDDDDMLDSILREGFSGFEDPADSDEKHKRKVALNKKWTGIFTPAMFQAMVGQLTVIAMKPGIEPKDRIRAIEAWIRSMGVANEIEAKDTAAALLGGHDGFSGDATTDEELAKYARIVANIDDFEEPKDETPGGTAGDVRENHPQ